MKINIVELREMVARAVRLSLSEARKAKLPAARSEESVEAERGRHVRGLPGYAHSEPLDMSRPLGRRSRTRRQGASNIGNWTSESRSRPAIARVRGPAVTAETAIRKLVAMVVDEELRAPRRR